MLYRIDKITLFCILLFTGAAPGIIPLAGQNAPVSTAGIVTSYGNTAMVPVHASGVPNLGSFTLKISFDPAVTIPVSVTTNPTIGGTISVNLNNPGIILLSWFTYPGVTITGNPAILNIEFSKITNGLSPVVFIDDGISCGWYDDNAVSLNDIPFADYYIGGSIEFLSPYAPHTIAPSMESCAGSIVSVPVRVTGFSDIGKVDLLLEFDPISLGFQSFTNNSGFPALMADGLQPGMLAISGIVPTGGSGVTLPDSSVLGTIHFNFTGGASGLEWQDNGVSCQYTGPPPSFFILNDTPQSIFYFGGSILERALPGQAGTISCAGGSDLCPGEQGVVFSVLPVMNAGYYTWTLPPGTLINGNASSNIINVSMGSSPGSGYVTVIPENACGQGTSSPPFPVYIHTPPEITGQPASPGAVNPGAGTAVFHVEAYGSLLTFQWQEYNTSWVHIYDDSIYQGSGSPDLTIIDPPVSMDGNHYRCIVSGFCPPDAVSDGNAVLAVSNITGIPVFGGNNIDQRITLTQKYPWEQQDKNCMLQFYLPEDGTISITIWDILGDRICKHNLGSMEKGLHLWSRDVCLAQGVYPCLLTLETGGLTIQKAGKIVIWQ